VVKWNGKWRSFVQCKGKWLWIGIACGVLLAALCIYRVVEYFGKNDKKRNVAAVAVATVPVEHRTITDRRLYTGTLVADKEYDAAAKVSGRLVERCVGFGNEVHPGELLARIDDSDYRRDVAQKKAELEVAAAQQQAAEATLSLREKEYKRQVDLGNATSRAARESAESTLLAQKAEVRMCKAEVQRCKVALETAQVRLADTRVVEMLKSPDSRYFVTETYADAGTLLKENQPILHVADIGCLSAHIYVIERDYNLLKLQQKAVITTDAFSGRSFEGKVSKIASAVEKNTRQAKVALDIPNLKAELKPGMFVRVELEFVRHENAQVIPRSAVLQRNGKPCVFLADEATQKAIQVFITTGISENDSVEVIEPKLELPVITLGNHLLSHQMPIRFSKGKK